MSPARYVEPFSILVAQLAYNSSGDQALAYLFERLGKYLRKGSHPGARPLTEAVEVVQVDWPCLF